MTGVQTCALPIFPLFQTPGAEPPATGGQRAPVEPDRLLRPACTADCFPASAPASLKKMNRNFRRFRFSQGLLLPFAASQTGIVRRLPTNGGAGAAIGMARPDNGCFGQREELRADALRQPLVGTTGKIRAPHPVHKERVAGKTVGRAVETDAAWRATQIGRASCRERV